MFKLEVTKLDNSVEHIWNTNKNEDNFLKFIPDQYGVTKDEVKAYLFQDSKLPEIKGYLNLGEEYALDIGEEGKIKVVTIAVSVDPVTEAEVIETTLVKEYVGQLIQWPYDTKGKFLGNGFEL